MPFSSRPSMALPELHALADLLVAIGVLELIVEGLGQIVGDEPETISQKCAAVLRHLPAREIAGEAVHDRQIELFWAAAGKGRIPST